MIRPKTVRSRTIGAAGQALGMLAALLIAAPAEGRTLFLNGTDISSSKNQELRGVNVRIGENGDVFIEAPHYQVIEEDTFVPLSSQGSVLSRPEHKGPQGISPRSSEGGEAPSAASQAPSGAYEGTAASIQMPASAALGRGPGHASLTPAAVPATQPAASKEGAKISAPTER